MAQLQKKFLASNAVDETKIRLANNAYARARNAADSADVNILKVNASDKIEFASVPQVTSDPSANNDLVRKSYVDTIANGLKWKASVRAATTANITLSGEQTIDGVAVVTGDRVLVKDQSTASQNGIYVADGGSWTRASDADAGSELVSAAVFVEEGTSNADKGFVCTTNSPVTIGVTSLAFTQFTNVTYLAGDGIAISGATISVDLDTDPGLEFNSGNLRVKVNSSGAIVRGANGIAVNLEASNPSLQISSNELGLKMDAAGALEKVSGGVRVKVDAATVKINGSNNLEGLKDRSENITLNGTDITNQYVDLAFAVYGTSASVNSISLSVVGGPVQQKTVDYTVSLTGGSGGVTRITFAGDLATAGNAALVNGDILVVSYSYLT